MKALTAVVMNARQMMAATMTPMTLILLNQRCESQPMVWNMLQNPCVR